MRIKIPFVENYKECTICASLRENTAICLTTIQAKTCCAMLRRGPIIIQIPRSYQKKIFIAYKVCNFLSVRWKFHCTPKIIWRYSYRSWPYLVCRHFWWARIRPKKLIRGVSCIHTERKALKSFGTITIKIPVAENYKKCTICAILREKTPICLAAIQAKTCYAMLHKGPIIMQIPRGYQKKKCLLRTKSAILSVSWKYHCIAKIILALFYRSWPYLVCRHFLWPKS